MIDTSQFLSLARLSANRLDELNRLCNIDSQKETLLSLTERLNTPEVWQDLELSKNLNQEQARLKKNTERFDSLREAVHTIIDLAELAKLESDESLLSDLEQGLLKIESELSELEFNRLFGGELDQHNCYLEVQPGSGGTEAQDWAEMLLRQYLKWCERRGFKSEILDYSEGEVAGVKSASVRITGEYAYGWLRTETGVHRLVRKSPFDSGNRRHTSFAAIFVSPEIDDNVEIDLNVSDIRVDLYRASGAGGQHVNKTESAVRLTHLPTNTMTQCQSSRSQHANKAEAMKQLRAKLYNIEIQKRNEAKKDLEDSKADIGWGSQIRSYVLDASRVKDLRTGVETSNTQAVLDGNIDLFIEAALKL